MNEESALNLVGALKGRLAELRCCDLLERHFPGYRFELSSDSEQSLLNIREAADEEALDMFNQICNARPNLEGIYSEMQIQELMITQDVHKALESLAENMGVDLPDEIG